MDLGVEPRRRLDRRTRHLPAAPASHLASGRLDLILPLEMACWDKREQMILRKSASFQTQPLHR